MNVQHTLRELRSAINEAAPESEETISYGMPTLKLNGILVHFAAYKKHIGFYISRATILAFKENLSIYNLSKGTVQFPIDGPIPLDIVKEMVRFKVKENLTKGVKKGKKELKSVYHTLIRP